ncbi:MAG: hypothetical protein ACM3H8_10740 [Sphingobacteriales bacterium]
MLANLTKGMGNDENEDRNLGNWVYFRKKPAPEEIILKKEPLRSVSSSCIVNISGLAFMTFNGRLPN